ncbi:serine/threonine-protein phosphatase [Methanothermococcus sp. SCGC AD-155-M21]|nr:serine/threonine-protein phosphatase [Methanothermococcus sp. SCGC AD-155-M21]MBW9221307.1 serine/threonine-protein phosphatase [Methanothermococcus sp. SCGC AD-155-M21]
MYFIIQKRKKIKPKMEIKTKDEIKKKENIPKKIKSEEGKTMDSETLNRDDITLEKEWAYGRSHKGNRKHNEDYILLEKIKDIYLLAVADGIGGHNAGEIASEMALDTLEKFITERYREDLSTEEIKEILREAYNLAHSKIKENAVGDRTGMGTTLTTAIIKGDKCIVANCGDSRAYLIRDGNVIDRTKDHSFVQALIDSGQISEEKAMTHPMKNIITSALGLDELQIEVYQWNLKKEDVLLLSSDGLHDYVNKEDILNVLRSNEDPKDIVNELLNIALEKTKDNVSIVVYKKH